MRMVALMVSRAGKADQGFRFGEDQIAQRGEAGGDAAHRGIGEDGDEQAADLVIAGQRGGDLGHLHERQNAFVHASAAAGAADDDQRQVCRRWPVR